MAFGTSCQSASKVVKAVREVYPKTLIVKLSPNVTIFTEIAKAVEDDRSRQCITYQYDTGNGYQRRKENTSLINRYWRIVRPLRKADRFTNGMAGISCR